MSTVPSALSALLSLSSAAAATQPIPVEFVSAHVQAPAHAKSPPIPITSPAMSKKEVIQGGNSKQGALKHRRLSSTGQTRRRMSDARDAAASVGVVRPGVHSAASAFASLTLSTSNASSPPSHSHHGHSHSLSDIHIVNNNDAIPITRGPSSHYSRRVLAKSVPTTSLTVSPPTADNDAGDDIEVDVEDDDADGDENDEEDGKSRGAVKAATAATAKSGKPGKKRGTIYRCESCSKVYRHPSCLVKHRWEHSPHWREASKLMLSKHQQVQLLEAAAVLSHLRPGSSLPEDRSLWPSYFSGGLLPPPSTANIPTNGPTARSRPDVAASLPITFSTSVPASSGVGMTTRARSGSTSGSGPRMFDYKLPASGRTSGITQIRPGILGMANPAPPSASPSPPPGAADSNGRLYGIVAVGSKPAAVPIGQGYAGAYGNSYRETSGVSVSVSSISGSVGASVGGSYGYGRGNGNGHGGGFDRRSDEADEPWDEQEPEEDYERERVSEERSLPHGRSVVAISGSHPGSGSGSGGWSLPHSDIRSGSRSLSYSGDSRSRSGSRSDDDESDAEGDGVQAGYGFSFRSGTRGNGNGMANGNGNGHFSNGTYGYGYRAASWTREENDAFAVGLDERDEMEYEVGKEREREVEVEVVRMREREAVRERDEEERRRKGLRAHEEEWVGMDMDVDLKVWVAS